MALNIYIHPIEFGQETKVTSSMDLDKLGTLSRLNTFRKAEK